MREEYWQAAARLMGMKRSEIVGLEQVEDGTVVTTHDGQRTLVTATGMAPWADGVPALPAAPAAAEVPGSEVAPEPDAGELEPAPESEPVPDGTAAEVLAWVGDDPERARRARDAEAGKDKPRAGLLAQLDKLEQG